MPGPRTTTWIAILAAAIGACAIEGGPGRSGSPDEAAEAPGPDVTTPAPDPATEDIASGPGCVDDPPVPGLYDDEYGDGHPVAGRRTPILPPGEWDWHDTDDDLANWRKFRASIGRFELLADECGRGRGWRLVPNDPAAADYTGAARYFHGSAGGDVLDLGPAGVLHSMEGSLGDGPDVLALDRAWAADFRTGSDLDGAAGDDDLVVAGCAARGPAEYSIEAATLHTGPGADRIFVRDLRAAAVDAGNGQGGRTDALDPDDGDDVAVFRGNGKDFRFFGGTGDDLAAWYVLEQGERMPYHAPNFFGGGGAGEAVWGDGGTDRLVLVLPPDTPIGNVSPTPPGFLRLFLAPDTLVWDAPTVADPYAKYCVPCGTGPGGRRTLYLEYRSPDDRVLTGYLSVTAFEILQLGDGPDAAVYRLDDVAGEARPAPDLEPVLPPERPDGWCD